MVDLVVLVRVGGGPEVSSFDKVALPDNVSEYRYVVPAEVMVRVIASARWAATNAIREWYEDGCPLGEKEP